MKTEDVVKSWLSGRSAGTGTLRTDGESIWSYGEKIGKWSPYGIFVKDFTTSGVFISKTVSRHVNLCLKVAGKASLLHPFFSQF